uniref:CSON015502 protein n=1 Tax=Culicoides sonorensis TaxID=179676 RepID=A0A336LU22_CULSO
MLHIADRKIHLHLISSSSSLKVILRKERCLQAIHRFHERKNPRKPIRPHDHPPEVTDQCESKTNFELKCPNNNIAFRL